MLHPAAIVALSYILVNLIMWNLLAPELSLFAAGIACVFTGSGNALLIVALCYCADFRTVLGCVLLTITSLLLFAFVPVSMEIDRVLPTDAQAALAFPFWGGVSCGVHALLSVLLLMPVLFRISTARKDLPNHAN